MFDLRELYQEVILDHSRHPRNFGRPADANREAKGFNPLCGDRMTVYLAVEDGVVRYAAFDGVGCAISVASASLMTEAVKGMTVAEAYALFARFQNLVAGDGLFQQEGMEELDKLTVLAGVRQFPIRVKCATLAWHTLRAAMDRCEERVTTE
ncbi:MAG: Fe-S cluster assembly sulfur transfer protein SufU [Alphaproteobacteria bacterium]